MKRWTKMLAGVALSAALLAAQRPERGTPPDPQRMMQMRVNHLATLLTLTEDQKTKATALFTEAHTASANARTAMENADESLQTAVKSNNTVAIDQAAATLGSLHAQLTAIHAKANAAFYALLTAEQKAKYDSMPRRGPGPGGPGGFGGFGRGPRPSRGDR